MLKSYRKSKLTSKRCKKKEVAMLSQPAKARRARRRRLRMMILKQSIGPLSETAEKLKSKNEFDARLRS